MAAMPVHIPVGPVRVDPTTLAVICMLRRCGLCRFYLEAGDQAHIVGDSLVSDALTYPPLLKTASIPSDPSKKLYLACAAVTPDDCFHERTTMACHAQCLRLRHPDTSRSVAVMRALAGSFDPTSEFDLAREKWLAETLASELRLPAFLPLEMRLCVAKRLVKGYSAAMASALPVVEAGEHEIDLGGDVWVVQVKVEGIKYVTRLATSVTAPDAKGKWFAKKMADAEKEIAMVHIREDHVGIQEVIFTGPDEALCEERKEGVWWKSIRVSKKRSLRIKTDCLKATTLTVLGWTKEHTTAGLRAWCVPRRSDRPESLRWHAFYHPMAGVGTSNLKLDQCTYNQPGTVGYSVCGFPRTAVLHSQLDGQPDPAPYASQPGFAVWLYTPMDSDEKVTEIWGRRPTNSKKHDNPAVRTNKGRFAYMGPHSLEVFSPEASAWTVLERSDGTPSTFYYDEASDGLGRMAFTSPEPLPGQSEPPGLAFPSTSPPSDHPTLFHSSAPLENVARLQPCYITIRGVRALSGMLIFYADGHAERLGHVRPYALESPVDVNAKKKHTGFYLRSSFGDERRPVLSEFGLGRPSDELAGECFEVKWEGTLSWWFSESLTWLRYGDYGFPKMGDGPLTEFVGAGLTEVVAGPLSEFFGGAPAW